MDSQFYWVLSFADQAVKQICSFSPVAWSYSIPTIFNCSQSHFVNKGMNRSACRLALPTVHKPAMAAKLASFLDVFLSELKHFSEPLCIFSLARFQAVKRFAEQEYRC